METVRDTIPPTIIPFPPDSDGDDVREDNYICCIIMMSIVRTAISIATTVIQF